MSDVVRICWTERCIEDGKWKVPAALLLFSLLYEIFSTQSMGILSGLYRAVSDKDLELFENTLHKALFIVFMLAFLKAISNYCNDLCAIRWRAYLVEHIHCKYAAYMVNVQNGTGEHIDTKDQRVTQDIDRLTTKAAKLVADIIVLPAVVVYYTCYLLVLFGWLAPGSCFLYFLIGSVVCYFVAIRLVDVVCVQEQLEGEFRQSHCLAEQHAQEVYLLRGEVEETRRMQLAFKHLLENSYTLVTRRFWVNLCTHWFAYAGAIVNYVVVGIAIFILRDDDDGGDGSGVEGSGADRVALLAQGSYACMYLISALSTILSSSESASEIAGLARRVSELLVRLSNCDVDGDAIDAKVSNRPPSDAAVGATAWSPLRFSRNSSSRSTTTFGENYQPLRTNEENDFPVSQHSQKSHGIEMGGITGSPVPQPLIVGCEGPQPALLHHCSTTPTTVLRLDKLDVFCEMESSQEVAGAFSERRLPVRRRLLVGELSLEVRVGMRLLVTGPSGCGKSTLLRLLAHATRNPQSTDNICFAVAPELIVFCPQTPHLFKGTLEDNLLYPRHHQSDRLEGQVPDVNTNGTAAAAAARGVLPQQSLHRALVAVGAEAFVESLRRGEVRDWAKSTSPGERQRLAVARAIAPRPPLVVLDEVSSALDEEAEGVLYAAVAAYCSTFISLGHRSSLRQFHSHELRLQPDGKYSFAELPH